MILGSGVGGAANAKAKIDDKIRAFILTESKIALNLLKKIKHLIQAFGTKPSAFQI